MSKKDELAKAIIERIVKENVDTSRMFHLSVKAGPNHSGDPSFSVSAQFLSWEHAPNEAKANEIAVKMIEALEYEDEHRHPYFYVSAPSSDEERKILFREEIARRVRSENPDAKISVRKDRTPGSVYVGVEKDGKRMAVGLNVDENTTVRQIEGAAFVLCDWIRAEREIAA